MVVQSEDKSWFLTVRIDVTQKDQYTLWHFPFVIAVIYFYCNMPCNCKSVLYADDNYFTSINNNIEVFKVN